MTLLIYCLHFCVEIAVLNNKNNGGSRLPLMDGLQYTR